MSGAEERHASWLELFFDLVVVVAVIQLAHRLAHPTWPDVALFVVLYYAIWSVWTALTLYSNVRGERTRMLSMLIGMFGIAVMAAAAPDVAREMGTGGTHEGWFIVAYIISRTSASRSLQRAGAIMTAWPAAQLGAGLTPWIASSWVEGPWRYVLWGIGVLLDLGFSMARGRRPERMIEELNEQIRRRLKRDRRLHVSRRPLPDPDHYAPAVLEPAHLGERLGLFVIIVLGEAVMQVVLAASGQSWGPELGLAALAGFGLIVSLWWITLQYGLSAVPGATERGLKAYIALPAHFAMTAGLTATAAGLGVVAAEPGAHLHAGSGWVLGGGLAVYFAASAALGVAMRASRRWIWGWAVPSVLVPPIVAAVSGLLPGWLVVVLLLLVALWRVAYRHRGGPVTDTAPDAGPGTAPDTAPDTASA
ncbi:low temperature requirement protein A [Nonomuraea sp. NPDC048882]|uniref:low temperature requirement protein A n=1 Tax=Nonomuraea sp. NPDC048882 TaxID=3154347 RepID=UPI0033FD76C3